MLPLCQFFGMTHASALKLAALQDISTWSTGRCRSEARARLPGSSTVGRLGAPQGGPGVREGPCIQCPLARARVEFALCSVSLSGEVLETLFLSGPRSLIEPLVFVFTRHTTVSYEGSA